MFDKLLPPDSNGTALERRNFDYLPDDLAQRWRQGFVSAHRARVPYPTKAIIELLNSCNLDCPMCRVGEHGLNIKRHLPMELFLRITAELPAVTTVRLNGLGESTLLPTFARYVDHLVEKNIHIELISNGSGQFEDYCRILDAGGTVVVSWDAADAVTFDRLRRPARWNAYEPQISKLANYSAGLTGACRFSLLFTLQPGNIGHLHRLVELCRDWSISSVIVNVAKLPSSQWIAEHLDAIRADFIEAATTADQRKVSMDLPRQIGGHSLGLPNSLLTCGEHCHMPWEEVVIRWNGDVQPCNMFNPFTYGNLHLSSFEQIWSNAFAALFRVNLNSGDRHPYCVGCTYVGAGYTCRTPRL